MRTFKHFVRTVIGAAYEVSNALGAGFLEKVYERINYLRASSFASIHVHLRAEKRTPAGRLCSS